MMQLPLSFLELVLPTIINASVIDTQHPDGVINGVEWPLVHVVILILEASPTATLFCSALPGIST
jgi:hypothetical protein